MAPTAQLSATSSPTEPERIVAFLGASAPFSDIDAAERGRLLAAARRLTLEAGAGVYAYGDALAGFYVILEGRVEVRDRSGALLSLLGPGDGFGERGLLREGRALATVSAQTAVDLLLISAEDFKRLLRDNRAFEEFFERSKPEAPRPANLAAKPIAEIMTAQPITCRPDHTIQEVARMMRDKRVACLPITDDAAKLIGIVTTKDLTKRALAEGMPGDTAVSAIMTADPIALDPAALGGDVLFEMLEHGIGHLPVVADGALIGIVSQTDLTRVQALSSATLIRELQGADTTAEVARLTARIPTLLGQLVGAGHRHDVITRLVTDIADAATRRLLRLAEKELGTPPVPYLWLACGSQGRREQTGVSDQDNCLFIDDAMKPEDDAYFEALARIVTTGLAECGYMLCPGDMMASNPRWRQPIRVWREYFDGWIRKPDPMAQMLASVMFDLRPVAGDFSLHDAVIGDVLERASANSIFVAHMVKNAVGHAPPLGLFGGVATIRSGEHKQTIDLKHNGVVSVVDLGRIYALQGRLRPVNTRARLEAALEAKVISETGGRDLIDAYDFIAETRLRHQARQARDGVSIDNFMSPSRLSDLERSHMRDAFVVVRTMQSALTHTRAAVM